MTLHESGMLCEHSSLGPCMEQLKKYNEMYILT